MAERYSVLIPWADRPVSVVLPGASTAMCSRDTASRRSSSTLAATTIELVRLTNTVAIPDVRLLNIPVAAFNRALCLNLGSIGEHRRVPADASTPTLS